MYISCFSTNNWYHQSFDKMTDNSFLILVILRRNKYRILFKQQNYKKKLDFFFCLQIGFSFFKNLIG